jgi:hypothetical protein
VQEPLTYRASPNAPRPVIKGRDESKKTEADAALTILLSAKDIAIVRRGTMEDLGADVCQANHRAEATSQAFDEYKAHFPIEIAG